MNTLFKAYCRTIQGVFRLALPLLPYRKPELLEGPEGAAACLLERNIRRALLVTGPKVRALGLTASLEHALEKAGIACAVYDRTETNPTLRNAEDARALYLREDCRAIIALGGGSPMDCAKAAGARIVRPGRDLTQMKGLLKVRRPLPPFIAIPTTAGSGSETTLAAVVVDEKTRFKYPINDFVLIPHYALLDPQLTVTLPPSVTAQTGMDALTHAVEAYIGRSTTAETRKDALEAVGLIFGSLETAYERGDDLEARGRMLRASYLAGCAFTKSYVGYVHAVAHSLGGQYDLPHGLLNAILLPVVLEAYGDAVHAKLLDLARAANLVPPGVSPGEGAERFIGAVREMNRRFGIPETIPELRREDIPQLAHLADREANPLYPVPILWDETELRDIYTAVLAG